MNREKDKTNAAVKYAKQFDLGPDYNIAFDSFIEGTRWSDEHPNIICHDSNKEQPTPGSRVLVLSNDGSIEALTNVLEVYKDKKWLYLDKFLSEMEK